MKEQIVYVRRRTSMLRLVWTFPAVALLLIGAALTLEGFGRENDAVTAVFALVVILLMVLLARWTRASEGLDVFEPVYLGCAVCTMIFPLRVILAIWFEEWWLYSFQPLLLPALLVGPVGFAAFAIGYRTCRGASVERLASRLDGEWNINRVNFVSAVFLAITLATVMAVRYLGGSLDYLLLLDREIKNPWAMQPWFYYAIWGIFFVQAGALLQVSAWLYYRRQPIVAWAFFALALGSTVLVSRLATMLLLLMTVILTHYLRRRITVMKLLLLVALVVPYLTVSGFYREYISFSGQRVETSDWAETARRYVVANFDQLYNLTLVVDEVPRRTPFQWGSTFLTLLFKPIPRSVMPSKPLGASGFVAATLHWSQLDAGYVPAASAWTEWYLNFWWIGVIAGMALMGMASSVSYSLVRKQSGPGRVVLYGVSIAALLVWLRGDFNGASTYFLYYMIPLAGALGFVTRARRSRRWVETKPLPASPVPPVGGPRHPTTGRSAIPDYARGKGVAAR
jgi:oligosaccharide repeat unit polymerase